ncbi:ABC transporter, permease protein, putative [gamma proteobacterium NOR5-3]|nr:ABC transporter, permease protein, putative [gamma proteobacterium NOR5-3]
MATTQTSQFMTLLQREFREYKTSLFWTPVITAIVLGVLMLGSVVLANRISVVGDTVLEALMRKGNDNVNITISIGEDGEEEVTVVETSDSLDIPPPLDQAAAPGYEVYVEDGDVDERWNFSREWNFTPGTDQPSAGDESDDPLDEMSGRELNVMLSIVHGILLLILLLTTTNYLLSSLYDDRKDRSVLFWRSMPVTEWQVVLSKFVVGLIVAPLLYIAISLLLQLAYVLLMILLVWRMDQDPFEVVVGNIDFIALMLDPISGWVMTALLIAPVYAWLLCASALARRSPFLMAITPVIGLVIAEGIFFGTEIVGNAVSRHFPHVSDSSAVGFYLFGPDWMALDLLSVAAGLVFTGIALAAAVWLRAHRWELN